MVWHSTEQQIHILGDGQHDKEKSKKPSNTSAFRQKVTDGDGHLYISHKEKSTHLYM